jgi:hypothetical protein
MLLFQPPNSIPKPKRQYRKRKKKEKKNIQLSLFDFQPRQLQFDFQPTAILNVQNDKIVVKTQDNKMEERKQGVVYNWIVGVIQEGTIPLLILTLIGICVGYLDYAYMMSAKPTHLHWSVALLFGLIIGFAPTALIACRQYEALKVTIALFAIDISIAAFAEDNIKLFWVYFALQVAYTSWKLTKFIALVKGDEFGRPVDLTFKLPSKIARI